MPAVVAFVCLAGGAPGIPVAAASAAPRSVSGVSVAVTPALAGISETTYTVGFKTSPQGALLVNQGSITVVIPGASQCDGETITDASTGQSGGVFCNVDGPEAVPIAIGGGDQVRIVITGVSTPTGVGSHSVTVSTSSDAAAGGSYSLAAAGSVSGVSVAVTPALAGISETTYTVGFKTSPQGALLVNQGSITVVIPGASQCDGETITDASTGQSGGVFCNVDGPEAVPIAIGGGDQVRIVITGASTPTGVGSHSVTVSTSSDAAAGGSYSLAAAGAVSGVSVAVTPALAGISETTYTVGFKTSPQGALLANQGTITVDIPGASQCDGENITDVTTGQVGNVLCVIGGPNAPTIPIRGGDQVRIVITGVSTPAGVGSHNVTVSTSSDAAASGSYSLAAAGTVSGVSVAVTPALAGISETTYTVGFKTSPQGALLANQGTITVDIPGASQCDGENITDVTTGQVGNVLCVIGGPNAPTIPIRGGDQVRIVITGVSTPAGVGSHSVTVSTSSDAAASGSYSLAAAGTVSGVSVAVTPALAGISETTYTVGFKTSPQGALLANQGTITVDIPGASQCDGENITDVTTGQVGNVLCVIGGPNAPTIPIRGGDQVRIVITGVSTPAGVGSHNVTVSTSSDAAASGSYSLAAAGTVSGVSVAVTPALAGISETTYTVGFKTSPQGALLANQGTITVDIPGASQCDGENITDVTTGQVGNVLCVIGGPNAPTIPIRGGDQVRIVITGVSTPAGVGSHNVTVSTSSDAAASGSYSLRPTTTISGTVTSAEGAPVPGADLEACPVAGGNCSVATSAAFGAFTLIVAQSDTYAVMARARGQGSGSASGQITVAQAPRTGITVQLANTPVPAGTTIAGQSSGVPTLNWSQPTPLTVHGCPYGVGIVTITATNTISGQPDRVVAALIESPRGSGNYTGTLPPTEPAHGEATVAISFFCLEAVLPEAGPSAGGTTVSISGNDFQGATGVFFGTTPASTFTVVSNSLMTAVAPPGTGTVDVSVRTRTGQTRATSDDRYSYFDITSLSATGGPTSGGEPIVIHGHGLQNVNFVTFGSVGATGVQLISDSEIDAVVPPGSGNTRVAGAAFGEAPGNFAQGSLPFHYDAASDGRSQGIREATPHRMSRRGAEIERGGAPTLRHSQATTCPGCGVVAQGGPTLVDWGHAVAGVFTVAGILQKAVAWVQSQEAAGAFLGLALEAEGANAAAAAFIGAALPYVAAIGAGALVGFLIYTQVIAPIAPDLRTFFETVFSAWIDPSGTVVDTNGNPVPHATVTILRGPGPDGPFTPVTPGDPAIQPSINPERTGATGAFHWDVLAGYYQITASAPGCVATGHSGATVARSEGLHVPPPQVGLVLTLACRSEPQAAPPRITSLIASQGPSRGHNVVFITGSGFTTSSSVSFGNAKAAKVTFLSPQALSVVAPAGNGRVEVTVKTTAGTSPKSKSAQYTYVGDPPMCTVKPDSAQVTIGKPNKGKLGKAKQALGVIAVTAKCDEGATGTLKDAATEFVGEKPKHGKQRTKVFRLPTAAFRLKPGTPRIVTVQLPQVLIVALEHGTAVSAVFTLTATNTNGTAHATAQIARLKV